MPPRINPLQLPSSTTCQCFLTSASHSAKQLSSTPNRHLHASNPMNTRLRREMWAWLNGAGKVFKTPRQGGTNYLGAYNKDGSLTFRRDSARSNAARYDPQLDEPEDVYQRREAASGLDPEEMERRAEDRARRRLIRSEEQDNADVAMQRPSELKPYPQNRAFMSQRVLSEDLREEVYRCVVHSGMDLNTVSAVYGVDVRRVAAVVRLKTIEHQWIQEGKTLAKPYNDAVLQMLPQTPLRPTKPLPHESINDLPVHPWTRNQLFYPASESRQFTREDAAKAFHHKLLPADERIPNKQLIQIQKWENEGVDRDTRRKLIREMDAKEKESRRKQEEREAEKIKRTQVVVPGRRWDFHFTDISAENVGKDGRGRNAIGHRYGMPHEDRKRGIIKIPTSVD